MASEDQSDFEDQLHGHPSGDEEGEEPWEDAPSSLRQKKPRLRKKPQQRKEEEECDDGTLVIISQQKKSDSNNGAAAAAAAAVFPPPRSRLRRAATMARDLTIILASYFCLFCFPPSLVSDPLGGGSSLSTRQAAPPVPFFAESSWVDDFYAGDIFAGSPAARDAFFMFYAPWDVDSVRARDVLNRVASTFEDRTDLYFAAVNCWTSSGECFKEFGAGKAAGGQKPNKAGILNQFPIFVFYPRDRRGIQYNGPVTETLLTQFLTNGQNPLISLTSKEDLLSLRAHNNGAAVVGFFPDLNPGMLSLEYRRFLQASYTLLESDPFRTEVGPFAAVVSKSLAFQLQLSSNRSVRYFFWNSSSVAYPNKTITSVASLVSWSWGKSSDKLTEWIGTAGRKSLKLLQFLQTGGGLSLVAFIPRTFNRHYNRALSVLQEVTLKYFSCSNETNKRLSNPLIYQMKYLRKTSLLELESQVRACLADPWFERQFCSNDLESHRTSCMCSHARKSNSSLRAQTSSQRCSSAHISFAFPDCQTYHLREYRRRHECALIAQNEEVCDVLLGVTDSLEDQSSEDEQDLHGLGCGNNRTLNFYVMDSSMQRELAESLGISPTSSWPSVLISDIQDETLYQMTEPFHPKSLGEFIVNFYSKKESLTKLQVNSHVPEVTMSRTPNYAPIFSDEKDSFLRVREINRVNFVSVVQNSSDNVVLLYHSSSCGLCASYAYVFHTVAHLLSTTAKKNLTFVSVDAGYNDLPWHFTALSVPSILFLPAGNSEQKAESRAFPSHKAMNVSNLLSFIIANLPPELRWQLSLSLCDDDCLQRSREEMAKRINVAESILLAVPRAQELDLVLQEEQQKRNHGTEKINGYTKKNEEPDISNGDDVMIPFAQRTLVLRDFLPLLLLFVNISRSFVLLL